MKRTRAAASATVSVTLRLSRRSKAELDGITAVEGRSQSAIAEEAISQYAARLPAASQRAVEGVKAARLAKPRPA